MAKKIEFKEQAQAFRTKAREAIEQWINQRITKLTQDHPTLAKAEPYARRAVDNYMSMYSEQIDTMIDNAALFIADKDGRIDVATMFDDLWAMYKATDKSRVSVAGMDAVIGGGEIALQIPDNFITRMMFKEAGQWITISEPDFLELKNLLL